MSSDKLFKHSYSAIFLSAWLGLSLSIAMSAPLSQAQEAQTDSVSEPDKKLNNDDASLPLKELQTFTSVFGQIRAKYVDEVDDKTLLRNAIRGMLSGLDPHSAYLDSEAFDELQEHTTGKFGGLGMEVGMEDGFIKVIAPIDDTPASEAGVQSGDLIIKLGDTSVKGLTLQEAVNIMRGEPGSEIDLTIIRESGVPFILTLTRAIIEVRSIRSRFIEPGYGYLRISQFQGNTGAGAEKAIKAMYKKTPNMLGLVVDLRNNPGGVLQAAVDITDLFIDNGTIVYTEGRSNEVQSSFESKTPDLTRGLPLIVLVNGGSASASEIVAGALQDHHRAVILGTTTFGKGSVQSVLPLSKEHAIKLTTALYFTPNGRSIQAQGIKPDIIVKPSTVTPLQQSILSVTEADLNGSLDNADGGDRSNSSSRRKKSQTGDEGLSSKDYQLYQALNMLKGLNLLKAPKSNKKTLQDNAATRSAVRANAG